MPKSGMAELYKDMILDEFKRCTKSATSEQRMVVKQIEQLNEQLNKARMDMLYRRIDADDFRVMKTEAEKEIRSLERKLSLIPKDTKTVEGIVQRGMKNLISMEQLYENGSTKERRDIVGSIFPENLTFTGFAYRTTRLNEAVNQIYLIDKELQEIKNGTSGDNSDLCRKAEREGFEPSIQV